MGGADMACALTTGVNFSVAGPVAGATACLIWPGSTLGKRYPMDTVEVLLLGLVFCVRLKGHPCCHSTLITTWVVVGRCYA
jgi:hypothetical protein